MDVAKAVSILLTNGGKAADYLGLGLIKKPGVPKIMIPTSAGTGAEVTFTAVFINEETGSKGGMNGDPLYPDAAILDPELTLSLPPKVTAYTGIDALTHALESYTSIQAHTISEMYSLEAVRLIAENLPAACADGFNQPVLAPAFLLVIHRVNQPVRVQQQQVILHKLHGLNRIFRIPINPQHQASLSQFDQVFSAQQQSRFVPAVAVSDRIFLGIDPGDK